RPATYRPEERTHIPVTSEMPVPLHAVFGVSNADVETTGRLPGRNPQTPRQPSSDPSRDAGTHLDLHLADQRSAVAVQLLQQRIEPRKTFVKPAGGDGLAYENTSSVAGSPAACA